MTIKCILFLFLVTLTRTSFGYETGCSLKPNELNAYGTNLTKIISEKKVSFPNKISLQSEFEYEYRNGQKKFYGTFEGFFRPLNDDFLSIVPIPILGFDLSKDRVVLYVCAHYSDKPEDSHLTIYFLRGRQLDPISTSNFLGHWFSDPSMKVQAVPATLLGIGEIKLFFIQIFRYIPFVDVYFETFSLVQRFFANLLGDVTGVGVERLEITNKIFRVSSGIDLNSPRNAGFSKTFKLKKPELGPGVKKPNSFNADYQKVLSDLDTTNVEFEEVIDQAEVQ